MLSHQVGWKISLDSDVNGMLCYSSMHRTDVLLVIVICFPSGTGNFAGRHEEGYREKRQLSFCLGIQLHQRKSGMCIA